MSGYEPLERDTMWDGRLTLWQPARKGGYRFNLDPILLAGFVAERPGPLGHVLDLGAGCGIIGLMLLATGRAQRLTAVERQQELAVCLRRNAQENGLAEQTLCLEGDLRGLAFPQADIVLFNPPYYKVGHGHAADHPGRDAGRREVFGTLDDFVVAAAASLKPSGVVMTILPEGRATQFARTALKLGLAVTRLRKVHGRRDGPAKHCLVEAAIIDAANSVEPELSTWVIHNEPVGYAKNIAALIDGVLPCPGGQAPR